MAVVTGARDTGNVLSDQRVIDMAKAILLLEPNSAPITVITKNLQSKAALDPLFNWLEDELENRWGQITNTAGYVAGDTTLTVDDSSMFYVESLVKVPRTGEVMYVSAVPNGTSITVERGVGASSAAAINDNDPLYIIGSVDDENSQSPAARSVNPTKKSNYTQIFRTAVQASGSWLSSSNVTTEHDWNFQRRKKGIEHVKSIELAALYGTSGTEAGTDGPRRFTGGLLEFLTQNNQDAGGTLTEATWETFLRTVFRYGGQNKTLFASPILVSALSGFSRTKLVTSVGDTTYGVKIMNLVSPHGEIKVVKHNLLEGAVYGGYGIVVDYSTGQLAYRYLNGSGPGGSRDTKLLTDRQETDRDGRKDEYLTECGFQVGLPKAHGVLTGVTG